MKFGKMVDKYIKKIKYKHKNKYKEAVTANNNLAALRNLDVVKITGEVLDTIFLDKIKLGYSSHQCYKTRSFLKSVYQNANIQMPLFRTYKVLFLSVKNPPLPGSVRNGAHAKRVSLAFNYAPIDNLIPLIYKQRESIYETLKANVAEVIRNIPPNTFSLMKSPPDPKEQKKLVHHINRFLRVNFPDYVLRRSNDKRFLMLVTEMDIKEARKRRYSINAGTLPSTDAQVPHRKQGSTKNGVRVHKTAKRKVESGTQVDGRATLTQP